MTNTSTPPTVLERLARVPNGALAVRLSLARTRGQFAQTPEKRAAALAEIDAIKRVMFERNLSVTE